MLRKILIGIGVFVAILPYLGFPSSWDTIFFTTSGLLIVLLLAASARGKVRHESHEERTETPSKKDGTPRALHVKRSEVEDYPLVHVEKETTLDTEVIEAPDEDTVVEKKVTVTHTRRRKANTNSLLSRES